MLAFSVQEEHVKDFMQHLFSQDTFIDFEVRGVVLHSFTYFEISGEKAALPEDGKSYCTWGELRPYVRNILKGRDKPRLMKLVFARPSPETLHPNAAALFLNITYEGDKGLVCTTAASQKKFEMDKSMDGSWDNWARDFFMQKGINAAQM